MLPGVHPRGDTAKGHSVLPGFGYFTWLYLMMCPFQIPIYIYILLYTYNHIDIGDVYMICILYIYTCMNAWTAYPDLEDKSIYFELC